MEHGFEPAGEHFIGGLGVKARRWRHAKGATHLHLDLPGDERCFFVAFRTPPQDSTGVAHVLEHTALCGSRRYPVRDPFFAMLTRSLATFMNAMTASDWTAYPFATRNAKDFDHLLEVYLDAVFFPSLHPLDFAQEGHRFERAQGEGGKKALRLGGVVFNEMKGAISSPTSVAYNALGRTLMAGSIYAHESGGDPLEIPDLSYEDLVAFHRRCYAPANAVFFTSGPCDLDALHARWQQAMDERAAEHGWGEALRIDPIPVATTPRRETAALPTTPSRGEKGDQFLLAWLLHPSVEAAKTLRASVLSDLLLDNSGSPLRALLEGCPWATSPAPLTGMDDSQERVWFACGLDGIAGEDAERAEDWLLERLRAIAEKGFAEEAVQASLRRLEFEQLQVGGDRMPFGLELGLDALPALVHGGDPMGALDPLPMLRDLRAELERDPAAPARWMREFLLDNPHRVGLHLRATPGWQEDRARGEEERLSKAVATYSEAQWRQLERQEAALRERQAQKDDPEVLPRLRVRDIPQEVSWPRPRDAGAEGNADAGRDAVPSLFEVPGNGILEARLALHPRDLTAEDLELLPLYAHCLDQVGTRDRNYLATAAHRASWLGSFDAGYALQGTGAGETTGWLSVGASCLGGQLGTALGEIGGLLDAARFDEHERIADLLARMVAARERSLAGSGHRLAVAAAIASLHPLAQARHRTGGLQGLQCLRRLRDRYLPRKAGELGKALERLHGKFRTGAARAMLASDAESLQKAEQDGHADALAALHGGAAWPAAVALPETGKAPESGWIIDAGVSYCAAAVPGPGFGHPDAAPLAIAAQWMQQRYLHPRVREAGGAYGVGAGGAGETCSFQWFSYRDPQMRATLEHFGKGVEHLLERLEDGHELEEAVLAAVGRFDQRGSPFGEAAASFHRSLAGVAESQLRDARARLVQCDAARVREATETWLRAAPRRVVVGGAAARGEMESLGLAVTDLTAPLQAEAA